MEASTLPDVHHATCTQSAGPRGRVVPTSEMQLYHAIRLTHYRGLLRGLGCALPQVIIDQLNSLGTAEPLVVATLEANMRDGCLSPLIVMLLRMLTSAAIQRRSDFFAPFIMVRSQGLPGLPNSLACLPVGGGVLLGATMWKNGLYDAENAFLHLVGLCGLVVCRTRPGKVSAIRGWKEQCSAHHGRAVSTSIGFSAAKLCWTARTSGPEAQKRCSRQNIGCLAAAVLCVMGCKLPIDLALPLWDSMGGHRCGAQGMCDDALTVEQFCRRHVEPMGEESDHVHIVALTDALQVCCYRQACVSVLLLTETYSLRSLILSSVRASSLCFYLETGVHVHL